MMTKKRTGSSASLKMLLAVPLAVALILMFSCKERGQAAKEATPAENTSAAEMTSTAEKTAPAGAEAEVSDEVYKLVDQMPVFRNDTTYKELTQWLVQNVKYPTEASTENIQGRVFVQFIVDEQGNVKDPEVIKGAHPLLDKAALEVIAGMPPWSPGKQGGKSVKVYMTVPISFALK